MAFELLSAACPDLTTDDEWKIAGLLPAGFTMASPAIRPIFRFLISIVKELIAAMGQNWAMVEVALIALGIPAWMIAIAKMIFDRLQPAPIPAP